MKKKIKSVLAMFILAVAVIAVISDVRLYVFLIPDALVGYERFFLPILFGAMIIVIFFTGLEDWVYDHTKWFKYTPATIFAVNLTTYVVIGQSIMAMIWGHHTWFLVPVMVVSLITIIIQLLSPFFKEGNN